jgi:putative ABC transport system permease protein
MLAQAAGLLGGWAMLGVFKRVMPEMPRADQIGIDLRVVAFTAGLSLVTAVVFAAAPLVHQLRADANEALAQGGRRTVAGTSRLRQFLTVAEIALAFVLVVGAGLIVQSLWRLMQVEPGFHSERVFVARVSLSASRYRTPAAVADFHRRVLERVRTLPDVQSAGATAFLPLGGTTNTWGFQIEHQPSPKTSAGYRPATAGFIESMRIPLISGRTFTDADSAHAARVVLFSETLRRTYFANQEAVGRRLRLLDPTMESPADSVTRHRVLTLCGGWRSHAHPTRAWNPRAGPATRPDWSRSTRPWAGPADTPSARPVRRVRAREAVAPASCA